jgi:hypothetical protein
MYIRLAIPEGLISWEKLEELSGVFGARIKDSFVQRKTYAEYFYKYPADIEFNLEQIQKLMDLGYELSFRDNVVRIK